MSKDIFIHINGLTAIVRHDMDDKRAQAIITRAADRVFTTGMQNPGHFSAGLIAELVIDGRIKSVHAFAGFELNGMHDPAPTIMRLSSDQGFLDIEVLTSDQPGSKLHDPGAMASSRIGYKGGNNNA